MFFHLLLHPADVAHRHGHGEAYADGVGDGLGDLDAGQAEESGQDEDKGDEEEAAPRARKERGLLVAARDLEEHVRQHGERKQDERRAVGAKRGGADFRDARIRVLEQAHHTRRADEERGGDEREHGKAGLDAERVSLDHAVVALGAEVVACHGLESLAEADKDGADEQHHAHDDRHRGQRRVAVDGGVDVQRHAGGRGQPLAQQRREAGAHDQTVKAEASRSPAQADPEHRAVEHEVREQDAEAHALTDDRGDRCAGDAHAEAEDEQRIERYVQQSAGDDADHREERLALRAQIGVHHERRGHDWRA